jgi:RNA-binding protein YlmH
MTNMAGISSSNLIVQLVEQSTLTGSPVFSRFVDTGFSRELVEFVSKSNVYFELWGGYPYAEMRVLGIDATRNKPESNLNIIRDGTLNPLLNFPIVPTQVRASNSDVRISFQNLIREIQNANLEDGLIGDVIESAEGMSIFTLEFSVKALRDKLTLVGTIPIITKLGEPDQFRNYTPAEESATVASNRLDALVSAVFRLSRDDGRDAVRNGMVKINDSPITKAAGMAKINDIIDLETRGRARICSFEETSKGRIRLAFVRYRRFKYTI